MKPSLVLFFSFTSLALFGCQSSSSKSSRKEMPQVIIAAVTTRPVAADSGAALGANYAGEVQPIAVSPANRGQAVYIPPKIAKTMLAAYEDEKGRLFGPQEMYEKVEEGKFNVQALQHPELAYIPPENLIVPPGMGNPVSAPAMQQKAAEALRLPTDYIDPRDVLTTGLLGKDENRGQAERMATAAGRRAVFDPDIGWILVPVSDVK